MGSMLLKRNLEMKKVKMESSNEAIKRGITIQTTFLTNAESKKKAVTKLDTPKHNAALDNENAAQFRLLKIMGF